MVRSNRLTSLQRIADARLLAPAMIVCAFLAIGPLVAGVLFSFGVSTNEQSTSIWTLEGYRQVLTAGRLTEFSLVMARAVAVTVLAGLIAVPTAYWIAQRRQFVQLVVLAGIVTPWLVSDMFRAFGWQLLLSPTGPISDAWNFLTGEGHLEDLRYNFGAVTLGLLSATLPAFVMSVFAAIPEIARSEWSAAAELGNEWNKFTLIAFGRAKFGILFGTCAVFVLSTFASAEPRFLDGPTLVSVESMASSLANSGVPALLAFGTLIWVTVFGAVACAIVVSHQIGKHLAHDRGIASTIGVSQSISSDRVSVAGRNLGPALSIAAHVVPLLTTVLTLGLTVIPLAVVSLDAFRRPTVGGNQWTLANFLSLFRSEDILAALANSGRLALVVSCAAAALGFVMSLVAWDSRLRRWMLAIMATLALVPGDVYAISLVQLLKLCGLRESGWPVLAVSHVLWALPFTTCALLLANQHLSKHVLESALEYSKGPISVVWRIVARINVGRIAGAALLAGVLSLNENVRGSYLGGGLVTISNEVHGRLMSGMLPENRGVYAAELLVTVLSLSAALLVIRFATRKEESLTDKS
jgi:spermidine/putrescine transport system permease protein